MRPQYPAVVANLRRGWVLGYSPSFPHSLIPSCPSLNTPAHYDRLLARCRPGTPFIGLNVLDEEPGPPIADVLPTDVPLTACLTPGGVWRF